MRTVTLRARSHATPQAVLAALTRYPSDAVTVHSGTSDWTLAFRAGTLRWTQRDTPAPEDLRLSFVQVTGDLQQLAGEWRVSPRGTGCDITFEARYALGVPVYDRIIEPLLAPILGRAAAAVLAGVPGDVTVLEAPQGPAS